MDVSPPELEKGGKHLCPSVCLSLSLPDLFNIRSLVVTEEASLLIRIHIV